MWPTAARCGVADRPGPARSGLGTAPRVYADRRDRAAHDYDWIVVGSGFGGSVSVSALRLAQRGYRVAVLETGRR